MIGVKRTLVATIAVSALLASGCNGDDPDVDPNNPGPVKGPPEGSSPLVNLTGEDLCAVFDRDAIQKEFKVELEDEPQADTRETESGFRRHISCMVSEPLRGFFATFTVSTEVLQANVTPDDALQVKFDDGYEDLAGLGDKAGYGKGPADDRVVVALRHNDTVVTLATSIAPEATSDQIRPYMESLLAAVQPKLK